AGAGHGRRDQGAAAVSGLRGWGSGAAAPRAPGASGGAALAGDPGPTQLAALLLGGAAPDARVLVGGQGELEAGRLGLAGATDGLGLGDLLDGRAGGADREEEVRAGVAAGGVLSPVRVVDDV